MKILQVWNNNLIDNRHLECINSVNTLCTRNNLDHTIVCTNEDLFQPLQNVTYVNYFDYIKDKDTTWWKRLLPFYQSQADFIRLDFAQTTGDLFYIDADVQLLELPVFEANALPYFGTYKGICIDFFLFYVNENTEFFVNLLNDVKRLNPNPDNWNIFMKYFATQYSLTGNNVKKVRIIPESTYKRNWFNNTV